jgi:hypothetical protein
VSKNDVIMKLSQAQSVSHPGLKKSSSAQATTNVSCKLCSVHLPIASSSSDAQPMGRADIRNPLAQLSSLTGLSPVAPFLSCYHLFLQPLLLYHHFFRWGGG